MPYRPLWAPDEVDIELPATVRMYYCRLVVRHRGDTAAGRRR